MKRKFMSSLETWRGNSAATGRDVALCYRVSFLRLVVADQEIFIRRQVGINARRLSRFDDRLALRSNSIKIVSRMRAREPFLFYFARIDSDQPCIAYTNIELSFMPDLRGFGFVNGIQECRNIKLYGHRRAIKREESEKVGNARTPRAYFPPFAQRTIYRIRKERERELIID
jgi:hypothetical protein